MSSHSPPPSTPPTPPDTPDFEQARAAFLAGLSSFQAGQTEEAVQHYRRSLHCLPGRPSTLINLAAALLRLGQAAEALVCTDAALAAEADSVDALLHRAGAQVQLGLAEQALASFQRLTTLAPGHALAWSQYGSLLRELQRHDEAAHALQQALDLGADPELHRYYLAALGAQPAPPAPPRAYVEALFDAYAADFDQHLVGTLGYCAHDALVARVQRCAAGARFRAALDLGCGTGLCGPLLQPLLRAPQPPVPGLPQAVPAAAAPSNHTPGAEAAGTLTGLDLSSAMLDRARQRGVYDALVQADAVQFLADNPARYDLVVAADVLIYIGDPAPLLAAAQRAMTGGLLAFTVEQADLHQPAGAGPAAAPEEADPGPCWQLLPSLRYAHHPAALVRLAQAQGFEPVLVETAPVRHDQGRPVQGLYLVLRQGRVAAPPP